MGKHFRMVDSVKDSICGLWADADGNMHICHAGADGARYCASTRFEPFLWTNRAAADTPAEFIAENLNLPSDSKPRTPLDTILRFHSPRDMEKYFKNREKRLPIQRITSVENQFLLANGLRMFKEMNFDQVRRLQLDIEVHSEEGFPVASRKGDRIIAVGLSGHGGRKILELEDFTDEAEKKLLNSLEQEILKLDPDLIEGHNIFKFDLPYIAERCKQVGSQMKWGRFGAGASFRKSRISIAERTFAYTRCDIPGRTVVDTLILVQLYDVSAREMPSYSLKESAIHFGISKPEKRTYIKGDEIKDMFVSDRKVFRAYLSDDLRETAALSAHLLPTYVAQVQNFPLTLQECLLRGSGSKVESVFLEKYYAARAALPLSQEGDYFEGALSESYASGVFKDVLHYDVASLYPSIMLVLGKCPRNDYLKTFLKELRHLREYRLKYKKMAREAEPGSPERKEYNARQNSFKILINSFYGYLGLGTAIFGDTALAAEVTKTGRELLVKLMEAFKAEGCEILEADTDGIYLSSEEYFSKPEDLLQKVLHALPDGIDLDYDGSYSAMLCYKAKNYALLDGDHVILKGSAFRNRATEPFLRNLTQTLIYDKLLGRDDEVPAAIESMRGEISSGKADIYDLAKGEYISKSPAQYQSDVMSTGKGRRAAMEAALLMRPLPEVGEKVSYYITRGDGKKAPDWKRARPLSLYDPESDPYDAAYYLKKIDDWQERFAELIGGESTPQPEQGELF